MDLFTGALALAPDANLTKVFDGVLAAARSSASLQCEASREGGGGRGKAGYGGGIWC